MKLNFEKKYRLIEFPKEAMRGWVDPGLEKKTFSFIFLDYFCYYF